MTSSKKPDFLEIEKIASQIAEIESSCRDMLPNSKFIHRAFLINPHGHFFLQVWATSGSERHLILDGGAAANSSSGFRSYF